MLYQFMIIPINDSNVYNSFQQNMKNASVIVLFLILCLSFALKIEHQQTPTSNTTSHNGTSSTTTNSTTPSTTTNTTSPTVKPATNTSGSQGATPATPATPSNGTSPATPATPATPASDDLTADEKKEYDAWKSSLIPWAKFENGEDKSAFFNSEVDKNYGQAKKNEIKAKRPKK